jgi:predicted metal-binding membrane protein
LTTQTATGDSLAARSGPLGGAAGLLVAQGGRRALVTAVLPVLAVVALAWTFTVRAGSGSMGMSLAAFVGSWTVMMIAMMLPAVAPVVGLYAVAARRGVVSALPVFVTGYLVIWAASALPAYAVARAVNDPLMQGRPWMARIVGATLMVAGAFQFSPLKAACLAHCRSPLSFFMSQLSNGRKLDRRSAALRAGVRHGTYCMGCCWALMAVLVVLGGMQLGWALALALAVTVEKLAPWGRSATNVVAAAAIGLGIAVLAAPSLLSHLISTSMMSTSMHM